MDAYAARIVVAKYPQIISAEAQKDLISLFSSGGGDTTGFHNSEGTQFNNVYVAKPGREGWNISALRAVLRKHLLGVGVKELDIDQSIRDLAGG